MAYAAIKEDFDMKMKLRVLTNTNKGKLLALAKAVADEYSNYAADKIDPAYPCDSERLVVIFVTAKAKYSDVFRRFCCSLNRSLAQNVALVVDGDMAKAQPVIDWIGGAGTNFCPEVYSINGGLPFKFFKNYTEEEKADLFAWLERTIQNFKA